MAYLYDAIDDHHIFLVSDILHSSESTADDAYQWDDGISQFWALKIKEIEQEIKLFCLLYLE
jgi:hypothetical protein